MSENIFVCDNFLNEDELEKATNIIRKRSWNYGHTSGDIKERFLTPFWTMNLNNNDYFVHIKSIIEKHFSKKFKLVRVYAIGQTYGQNGSYHIDSDEPNTYTFCLYLTNIEKEAIDTAGGYIYFKLKDKQYNICYEPLFNRGIMFPSNIYHKGCAFNRYIMDMRICVAWKLQEI